MEFSVQTGGKARLAILGISKPALGGTRQLTLLRTPELARQRSVNSADCGAFFRLDRQNKKGTMFRICSSTIWFLEASMLKIFVEEAAALASLTLFVGMIAIWAQLFTQL
jgi:hypothetical protein